MRPLCCPLTCCDTAARMICQSCSSMERPASHGRLAHLHFRGSLGRYFYPPMYGDNMFLIVYQLSTLASQQHIPSLCSYSSQRKVGFEQEPVPKGRARGVCDARSPPPQPSPQHSYSEMDFKACLRAGMNKPISLCWYKRHRPEKGQFKGFGGQTLPVAVSGGAARGSSLLLPFCSFQHEVYKHRDPFPISGSPSQCLI